MTGPVEHLADIQRTGNLGAMVEGRGLVHFIDHNIALADYELTLSPDGHERVDSKIRVACGHVMLWPYFDLWGAYLEGVERCKRCEAKAAQQ